jgi:hypothetical protein
MSDYATYGREYYLKNKERIHALNQKWREKNKESHLAKAREYHHKNREEILPKKRKRWKENAALISAKRRFENYGLTPEDFDHMILERAGCCDICLQPALLVVDHNHETGKVRGLLCDQCNQAIGLMRDDAERLKSAAVYLTAGM